MRPTSSIPKPIDGKLTLSLLSSLIYIYYAYTGWNAAAYMAGEVREPQKLLPRAVLLGTGGVLLLYLALNVVYGLALSADDVGAIVKKEGFRAVEPIAQLAAERLFGTRWSNPLSIAFGLMLLSSLSAYLLIGPRVLFAMAQAGQFPCRRGPADAAGEYARGRHAVPDRPGARLVLDRVAAQHHRICRHRALDLLDAGHELDLHPPMEAARPASTLSARPDIRSRRRCTSC